MYRKYNILYGNVVLYVKTCSFQIHYILNFSDSKPKVTSNNFET